MEFVLPLVLLGALVSKFTDFLKYVRTHDWNAAATQVIVWAAGVTGVLLFSKTNFAGGIAFGEQALSQMNFYTQLVIGLSATSVFSTVYDFKSAVDGHDTAKTGALFTEIPARRN